MKNTRNTRSTTLNLNKTFNFDILTTRANSYSRINKSTDEIIKIPSCKKSVKLSVNKTIKDQIIRDKHSITIQRAQRGKQNVYKYYQLKNSKYQQRIYTRKDIQQSDQLFQSVVKYYNSLIKQQFN